MRRTAYLLRCAAVFSFLALGAPTRSYGDTLGSVTEVSSPPCTQGLPGTCYVLQVSGCSEAAAIDVDVKVSPPSDAVAGAVLFMRS